MARRTTQPATIASGAFLVVFGLMWSGIASTIVLAGGGLRAFTDDSLVKVEGRVVDLVPQAMSEGGTGCKAVVGYAAPDGTQLTVMSSVTESPCRSLGETTKIYVDPSNPTDAIIDPLSGVGGWMLPVFLLIGVVILLAGVTTMARAFARLRREPASVLPPSAAGTPDASAGSWLPPGVPGPPPGAPGGPWASPGAPTGPASAPPGTWSPPAGTWSPQDAVPGEGAPSPTPQPPAAGGGAQVAPPLF